MIEEPTGPKATGEEAPEGSRPAFMGTAAPVPERTRRQGTVPRWVPLSIVAALVIGFGLGVGGALLISGGDGAAVADSPQAAAGPGGEAAAVSSITLPQAGPNDPDAFGEVEVTGAILPRFAGETDLAIGMAAPELTGFDFEGTRVAITNDGKAKIILFVAHWCPYCQQEVPVVRDWFGTTELPADIDVYSVSTLTDFSRSNYPPRTWFEQESWNVPLIVDDDLDTAAGAFGLNAVPFWVFIDTNGIVTGRHAGGGVPADALTGVVRVSPTGGTMSEVTARSPAAQPDGPLRRVRSRPMETLTDTGAAIVHRLVAGPLENNVFIVACKAGGEAVIIDAADDADRILDAAAPYLVQAILTTHSHADHIGAAEAVCHALKAPFRIHPADAAATGISPVDPISDGEEICFGDLTMRAIHTRGHTPGSTCFLLGDLLFSGDTLFPGGPGATTDPDRFREVMTSLEQGLFTLPDTTRILPGHGPSTTIGTERPSLPEWWRRGY